MGSILFNSFNTKNNIDAYFPQGLKVSLVSSILFIVCSAYSRFCFTSSDFSLEVCNFEIRSTFSSKLTLDSCSCLRIESSNSIIILLPSAIL